MSRALKLPLEYCGYDGTIEDTFAHGVLDALLTTQFPARSAYKLDWANLETEGSKLRRVFGNKPDGVVKKSGAEVAFMELKAPKDERNPKADMEDWWNIANFCKDALDAHIRKKRNIFKVAGLQVFGMIFHILINVFSSLYLCRFDLTFDLFISLS